MVVNLPNHQERWRMAQVIANGKVEYILLCIVFVAEVDFKLNNP